MRTNEILAGCQGSHLYGVVNTHPWWSGYSASKWGQYRTSGCPPSEPGPLCSPMDCMIFGWHQCPAYPRDGPSCHCTYEEVCVSNTPWRESNLLTLILCLIKAVLPRYRSLWANRCSHLSSSSLACPCSGLGHCPRPWRSRASRIHPFCGVLMDSPKSLLGGPLVVLGWQAWPGQLPSSQGFW